MRIDGMLFGIMPGCGPIPEPSTVHRVTREPLSGVSCRMSLGRPYADNLVIISESRGELQENLIIGSLTWKIILGQWVNQSKSKVLVSGAGLDVLQKSGKYSCSVCFAVVGTNSIPYKSVCSRWVPKVQWYLWNPEAQSHLYVYTLYWIGQTSR